MITYSVACFESGSLGRVGELQRALNARLSTLDLEKEMAVEVVIAVTAKISVAVYFGETDQPAPIDVISELDNLIANYATIFPVVAHLADYQRAVPESLWPLNGIEVAHSDYGSLVSIVLRELGIEERFRRAFISHRRSDGAIAAAQIHDQLSHGRVECFIDQFAIAPGADVQREVRAAIEDFPLLLLLETPDAHASRWVFDEVDYALVHRMGIVIVRWPGAVTPVPLTDRLPRFQLLRSDFVWLSRRRKLKRRTINAIRGVVEVSLAETAAFRRKAMVSSAIASARARGWQSSALPGWALLASSASGAQLVIQTVASTPKVRDLFEADSKRESVAAASSAHVLHETQEMSDGHRELLDWSAQGKPVALTDLASLGTLWS